MQVLQKKPMDSVYEVAVLTKCSMTCYATKNNLSQCLIQLISSEVLTVNSKNIAYERTMQQIGDIQTYVESIEDMLRETRKSIVQDLDLIATELTYHVENEDA